MAAGFGGGAGLFIPFIAAMLKSDGYRATFLWTGAIQGLVILIVAQVLRHPSEAPAGPAAAKVSGAAGPLRTQHSLVIGSRQAVLIAGCVVLFAEPCNACVRARCTNRCAKQRACQCHLARCWRVERRSKSDRQGILERPRKY